MFFIYSSVINRSFFRFINFDQKVYWYDETITSLRVASYRHAEVVQQIFDGKKISVQTLQKYQKVSSKTTLLATIYSLATEAPQHPPLYFLAAQLWTQWLGDLVATMRSLSVLISILIFSYFYWLCIELFGSSLTGWIAIALIAVSPFHVLYAQKAGEYSLWTSITIPILILEIYSTYFCKKSLQKAWLFILTLVEVTAIALVLPDLLWGGRRSTVSRYFITCYLGIHLSVAYLIATQITSTSFPQRKIWQIIIAMLISCGILSCAISPQSVVWWNKYNSYDNPQVARTHN
ncbi:hypothetical protein [Gloeocapsopsis sp. IPPAS B-1203]|uniref:glycosyltransferase family 39 protein n=1 Tax=Gloeocapsopsis sp. IPPAS B-1203 TaxID=2049454 RepID=UPI000C193CEE|nr:hypothetical protein [Gloeocapsopsis sp. IPPAS B-1203]PIG92451.1 hypothetical protein CSQ79_15270 [Gloeocapsopsis sp. IPPAS B-1203]